MTGIKARFAFPFALAATLLAAPAGQAAAQNQEQTPRVEIVVDKSCLIQPESDPSVLGDHTTPSAMKPFAILRACLLRTISKRRSPMASAPVSLYKWPSRNMSYKRQPTSRLSLSFGTMFRRAGQWTPIRNPPAWMAQPQCFGSTRNRDKKYGCTWVCTKATALVQTNLGFFTEVTNAAWIVPAALVFGVRCVYLVVCRPKSVTPGGSCERHLRCGRLTNLWSAIAETLLMRQRLGPSWFLLLARLPRRESWARCNGWSR